MRRSAGGLVLVGIVTALAAAACEVDSINGNVDLPDGGGGVALPDGSTSGIDSGAASGDWNGGGDGDAGGDAGADVDAGPQGPLPFTPSNIALDGVDVSNVGAWVVDQPNCALDTMAKTVGCGDPSALEFTTITQSDGSKVGVYVARSIRIEAGSRLSFVGTQAIALVALDTFEIEGAIDVGVKDASTAPGGFGPPALAQSKGGGPGGGGAGSGTSAGGGGSYCGQGGLGATIDDSTPTPGGAVYGNPEIIPLVGGSAGGSAALSLSGGGGGAIQLVGGKSFRIAASGSVSAGGGGGHFWGAVTSQHAAGGGSGGAILIESPNVQIAGIVAANGGGGGASAIAEHGTASATAAAGSSGPAGSAGGNGSAGDDPKGGNAVRAAPSNAPGGGGGAGRIRINSLTGSPQITGILSPSVASSCATYGKVNLTIFGG